LETELILELFIYCSPENSILLSLKRLTSLHQWHEALQGIREGFSATQTSNPLCADTPTLEAWLQRQLLYALDDILDNNVRPSDVHADPKRPHLPRLNRVQATGRADAEALVDILGKYSSGLIRDR
jgi:uncharacterized protein YqcC (DUF446 family)